MLFLLEPVAWTQILVLSAQNSRKGDREVVSHSALACPMKVPISQGVSP